MAWNVEIVDREGNVPPLLCEWGNLRETLERVGMMSNREPEGYHLCEGCYMSRQSINYREIEITIVMGNAYEPG
jgi:hypothetical protein